MPMVFFPGFWKRASSKAIQQKKTKLFNLREHHSPFFIYKKYRRERGGGSHKKTWQFDKTAPLWRKKIHTFVHLPQKNKVVMRRVATSSAPPPRCKQTVTLPYYI
eukprot:GEMP01077251.1.p1 GENE.GEMP01077251.1~~GEMP01077251.1.p1  ORF type:complete len:105 (-),score=2.10 GEMP01077251.1:418-732(-)